MGLIASIYKDRGRSHANDGLSDRFDMVTIVNVSGPFEPTEDRPGVELVRHPSREGLVLAVPVERPETPHVGPMMGGSYIATSDSRFSDACERIAGHRFYGAVPLHDRFETAEQYAALSR